MTITQWLPQWLRRRFEKPSAQSDQTFSNKERQPLPIVPKPERPPVRLQDDESRAAFHLLWRL